MRKVKWLNLRTEASHTGFECWLSLFLTTALYRISLVCKDVPKVLAALEGMPPAPASLHKADSSHPSMSPYRSARTSTSSLDRLHHPPVLTLQGTLQKLTTSIISEISHISPYPSKDIPYFPRWHGERVCDPSHSFPNGICHLESEASCPQSSVAKTGGRTPPTLSQTDVPHLLTLLTGLHISLMDEDPGSPPDHHK